MGSGAFRPGESQRLVWSPKPGATVASVETIVLLRRPGAALDFDRRTQWGCDVAEF